MGLRPSLRPLVLVPVIALAVGGAFAGGVWYERESARAHDEWADARLLSTAIDSVRVNALDSLPSDELIRRAVSGMLRELQDPYAALLRTDGYAEYQGTLQGEGRGLGVRMRPDWVGYRVEQVIAGSPAAVAGVRPGDRVLQVDGVPVSEAPAVRNARADSTPSSQVVYTLTRAPRGDTLRISVPRRPWRMPAVTAAGLLADSVGYVRLATISAQSADELEQAVEGLLRRGAQSLVLDLRGNGGGLFEEGVRAAGLFLPRGTVVASLSGRGGAAAQPVRVRQSRWSELPLTVLVDGRTASAAEVIAAALHDHGRALLVGAPTYGKGLVQRVVRLTPDMSLRLTTARWLTPRGVALEKREGKGEAARGGIEPDVWLDQARLPDPHDVPAGWTEQDETQVWMTADTLARLAMHYRWSAEPPPALEARLRDTLALLTPARVRGERARAEWVSVATRMTIARVFETEQRREAWLRYQAREDAALRAGLDVVAPGAEPAPVVMQRVVPFTTAPSPVPPSRSLRP